MAAWLTDQRGFSVSGATVYRLLRREGLIKPLEVQMAAGKKYTRKTTGPHQFWATDASYFRVAGWGYYDMVTVMDDFSRSILAWRLQRDMTSDSLIEAVQDAVDTTGMTEVPVEDTTKLLTDNGPGYVSKVFREYLRLLGIRNILAAPFHPRTRGSTHVAIHGKLERYHQTIKPEVNQCGQQPERYPQDQRVTGLRHAKQPLDSPSGESGEGQVGGQRCRGRARAAVAAAAAPRDR